MTDAVYEAMPVLAVDKEWNIVSASPKVESLFRWKAPLIGLNLEDLFVFPTCLDDQFFAVRDGTVIQVSLHHFPDNRYNLSLYKAQAGYAVQVTELSNFYCQSSLEDEQTRILRHAVDSANLGVWCYDLGNKVAYFSPKFKTLLGLNASDELDWEALIKMLHPDDQSLFAELLAHHIEQGLMIQCEFRVIVRGVCRWFEFKGEQVKYCVRSRSIYGILADCTYEKDMLIALHDAEESKELAMQAGIIGTWRGTNISGRWIWSWDSQANEIFKLDLEDIGNLQRWKDLLHPADKERVITALEHSISNGSGFEQRYRCLVNNDVIYVYAKAIVGLDNTGKPCRIDGVVIEQTDIYIAQKKLQHINQELEQRVKERTADLEAAIEAAERASRTKSDFLSMMSHELRTPMNGIIGALDLLTLSDLSDEDQELIETASISANNLVAILNEILDLAKVEQGKMELESYLFNPSNMLHNIVKTFEAQAREKGIKLEILESPDIPIEVSGDEKRIRQIIFNIISNAIKFSVSGREGGPVVKINVDWKSDGIALSHITYRIEDNGIGITNAVQKKLFSPFTQAEPSTNRKFGGTGLGLAICGKLVDLMGGKISLDSQYGCGTTFEIDIPIWKRDQVEAPTPIHQRIIWFSDEDWHKEPLIEQIYLGCNKYSDEILEHDAAQENTQDAIAVAVCLTSLAPAIAARKLAIPTLIFCSLPLLDSAKSQLNGTRIKLVMGQTHSSIASNLTKLATKLANQDDEFAALELSGLEELLSPTASHCLPQESSRTSKCQILLAEDNPFNQKLLVKQLKKLELCCDVASDGKQALEMLFKKKYRLLLTDCHMPEMNGYELTKQIRVREKLDKLDPIPIIAVTGAAMKGEREYCLSCGMNDFVSKPLRLKELKETLSKWLVQRQND
ncbi:ATP-binding protein (plasmid) [Pseudoalteromonas sp. T1lg65]|uniref:hybrid sensor histidine kinase/response regulator n=1 Tax=Pseudoalteromonas sp. T1lg65 TaxID=2077101 RepID=UPI003F7ACFE8